MSYFVSVVFRLLVCYCVFLYRLNESNDMDNAWTFESLTPQHRDELIIGSGISREVIEARRYRSIHRPINWKTGIGLEEVEWLRSLGFSKSLTEYEDTAKTWPMLWVPSYGPSGVWSGSGQLKPHSLIVKSNGKTQKYASPVGKAVFLDVHPFNKDKIVDPTVPLWIVEGVKKADSLTSRGHCTVALPGVYNWRDRYRALGEWEDVVLRGRQVVICFDSDARTNRNVAQAMKRLGLFLRSRGVDRIHYVVVPSEFDGKATKGVDDYFAAGGTVKSLQSSSSSKPPEPKASDDRFIDARLAERVVDDVLDGQFLWVSQDEMWRHYDGMVWHVVNEVLVIEALRQWALGNIRDAADALARGEGSQDEVKAWMSVGGYGRLRTLVRLCQGIVAHDIEDFDPDAHLLNTPTGVVDLRTGEIHDHDPAFMMTKITSVGYDPMATHTLWDKALEAVPVEAREWFQLRMGQAAYGRPPADDCVVFLVGDGSNGKSTVKEAVGKALGGYHAIVSERLLMPNKTRDIPVELMSLIGARLVIVDETPAARWLDTQRLKMLTGQSKFSIRAMRVAREIVTDASHTLLVNTNYRPMVGEVDRGTWRRLLLLDFPYTFVPDGMPLESPNDRAGSYEVRDACERDPEVHKAVLRWIIDGARQATDTAIADYPATVRAATELWQQESNPLGGYIAEFLERGTDLDIIPFSVMYAHFSEWIEKQGLARWSERLFSQRISQANQFRSWNVVRKNMRKRLDHVSSEPPGFSHDWMAKPVVSTFMNVRYRTLE